jgi:glucose/mannose transport system permease protein
LNYPLQEKRFRQHLASNEDQARWRKASLGLTDRARLSAAMYIAGMATISPELREAARIDGANEFQIYTNVIMPLLRPVTVSTAIILGHVSLKIFDLVFAMTGSGPGFATDVPGIFVFDQTFKATKYNLGAAASVVMLFLVSMIIVPYLWSNLRKR